MSAAITSLPLAGKKGLILGLANEYNMTCGCAHDSNLHGADLVTSWLTGQTIYVDGGCHTAA